MTKHKFLERLLELIRERAAIVRDFREKVESVEHLRKDLPRIEHQTIENVLHNYTLELHTLRNQSIPDREYFLNAVNESNICRKNIEALILAAIERVERYGAANSTGLSEEKGMIFALEELKRELISGYTAPEGDSEEERTSDKVRPGVSCPTCGKNFVDMTEYRHHQIPGETSGMDCPERRI